jgi:hypothetical protein
MAVIKSWCVVTVAVLALAVMTVTLAQEPAGGNVDKVTVLQKQKLDLLTQRFEEAQARYKTGRVKPDAIFETELDLLDYKLQLATDKQARIDLLNAILKNRQENEEQVLARYSTGRLDDSDDRLVASIQRIDAQIALADEQAKAP